MNDDSKLNYKNIIEHSKKSFMPFEAKSSIIKANPVAYRLSEYEPEEIESTTGCELFLNGLFNKIQIQKFFEQEMA